MAEEKTKELHEIVSAATIAEIDQWIAKFPAEQRQSAVIQALRIVQDEKGWLSDESIAAVAHYLRMPKIAAYEVATFYTMYNLKPIGKHKVEICTNISCMLNDAEKIMGHLENRLAIKCGETTADGRITLKSTECLGACVGAPACQIGRHYHENLTIEKIDQIVDGLK